jgi:alpha-beta hydrolase superfamily lysophospholipase
MVKHAKQLELPLLVQCGSEDKILSQYTPFFQEGLENMYVMKDKTIKIYQGLYHEIFKEPKKERDVVLNDFVS